MSRLAIFLIALMCLPGCAWSVAPVLPFIEPPPNLPADVVLFTVPEATVDALKSPAVEEHLQRERNAGRMASPERVEQVLDHKVLTGMTTQQVIWSFRAHPTEVVDDGPPGGHVLLWGQHRSFAPSRFWVRFNEWGRVTSAGRF